MEETKFCYKGFYVTMVNRGGWDVTSPKLGNPKIFHGKSSLECKGWIDKNGDKEPELKARVAAKKNPLS